MKHIKPLILSAVAAVFTTTSASAEDWLLWQDNSLSLLIGKHFELDPDTQETVTFEHASGWSFGDLFVFVDGIYYDGDRDLGGSKLVYYGEVAPRFSASKIFDKDLSHGIIKDISLATCWEFGENSDDNYLIGPGVDLDLPGFDYLQLNLYRRFNNGQTDPEAFQLTTAWKLTHELGQSALIFDGFIDWVFGEGTDNLHICPQVKLDIGVFFGLESRSLFAGIEYDYWKNKYSVRNGDFGLDSNQNTFSWLLKYHF